MDITQIVSGIDDEIRRLQQARVLLLGINGSGTPERRNPGRPSRPGRPTNPIASTTPYSSAPTPNPQRSTMSPEARKRIADSMRRRWAEKKKATAAKAVKRNQAKVVKSVKASKAPSSSQ